MITSDTSTATAEPQCGATSSVQRGVAGADLDELLVRAQVGHEEAELTLQLLPLCAVGGLAGVLRMVRQAAEQLVVDLAVDARPVGCGGGAEPVGQDALQQVVLGDLLGAATLVGQVAARLEGGAGGCRGSAPR